MYLTLKEIDSVKETAPGYIGGKQVATKATDSEISFLVKLNDEAAKMHNSLLMQKKYVENLQNSIKNR